MNQEVKKEIKQKSHGCTNSIYSCIRGKLVFSELFVHSWQIFLFQNYSCIRGKLFFFRIFYDSKLSKNFSVSPYFFTFDDYKKIHLFIYY